MRRTLIVKVVVTGVLALMLCIPLGAIEGIVRERQASSNAVLQDIQGLSVRPQTFTGPILIVPYRTTTTSETVDEKSGRRTQTYTQGEGELHFLPKKLAITGRVGTERRYRGIYSALLYNAQHAIEGAFDVPEGYGVRAPANVAYEWGEPRVIVGISDTRGIRGTPVFKWNGAEHAFLGGTLAPGVKSGIHVPLRAVETGRAHTFAFDLVLAGSEHLDYVPVGKETVVTMQSEWPHPSFFGQFLPEKRTISAGGFDATWRTTHLASGIEGSVADALYGKSADPTRTFGVSFIEPVSVYLETERAAKYGFLFVVFTFVIFQLFELMKKLAIHPVQYGLVGIALAMFFLLLTALAEHIPFAAAYAISGASCVGLLGFYVSFVLRSVKHAAGFTAMLSTLYASLYVLLQSEDLALLLGAVLLFAILAVIMVVTRKVDWHRITVPVAVADDARA